MRVCQWVFVHWESNHHSRLCTRCADVHWTFSETQDCDESLTGW